MSSVSSTRLVVLSGPSGVGKGSVVQEVRRTHPEIWISVSVTTRAPRTGEQDGVEYHFADESEFERMVQADEFLEHATYAGHRYGTPRTPVEEHLAGGESALLEIDLQGARQVRASMPEALLVFLAPPSWEELVRRLTGRASEDPAETRRRLDLARIELAAEDEFDVVVVNDEISRAAERLVALIANPGT